MHYPARFCAALLALAPADLQAGVVIDTVEREVATGKEQAQRKIYVQGGAARIEGSGGEVVVFKDDALMQINASEKTYRVMDRATIEKMAGAAGMAMRAMQSMSPEQRAAMEAAMSRLGAGGLTAAAQAKPPVVEVTDAGVSDKVNGRSCRLWHLKRDGKTVQEFCLVPYASLPGREDIQALAKKMSSLFESLQQSMPAFDIGADIAVFSQLNGYPVRQRQIIDGKSASSENVLKNWTEQAIPANLFEVPAGYTRKDVMSSLR